MALEDMIQLFGSNIECFKYLKRLCPLHFPSLFLSLKESTCETRKNVFYFTSKAFFVFEKIKF